MRTEDEIKAELEKKINIAKTLLPDTREFNILFGSIVAFDWVLQEDNQ